MIATRPLLTLPLFVLLAACGGSDTGDTASTAPGEVLEGTISDEMLPLDRVRSHAPLEAPVARETGGAIADEAEEGADGEGVTEREDGADAEPAVPVAESED